jgi:hypothetical protein
MFNISGSKTEAALGPKAQHKREKVRPIRRFAQLLLQCMIV